MNFIGIDIGTSTICSVVYNPVSKKTDYKTIANNTAIQTSDEWEKLQDPGKIVHIIKDILSGYIEKYPDINGIGITGQMHGILYIDRHGNAISPLYTWQDGRGNRIYKDDKTYAAFISGVTGYKLATGYGLVTHFYNKINNSVPREAKKICTIADYVVMKLAGKKEPVTDYSNGAGLGFFDTGNLRFDNQTMGQVGIDASIVPDTVGYGSCFGYYKDIPVYPAIGDNQAAFIGSIEDKHRSVHITVGTSSQISVYSDKYVKIPELDTRPFPGGGYILVGAALCGGQAFSILKNFFEKTFLMLSSREAGDADIYKMMTSVPFKDNSHDIPIVKTLFDGTRSTPGERGSINNISATNFTPENLIVGFLKGICDELYNFYNHLPDDIKREKNNMTGSGNALKKNPLLCKVFEDRFNLRLNFSHCMEEAAFGACLASLAKH
ncbi:MAG: hypothetical protein LBC19_08745 [Tannerella sp.]|jgi:sedoheptulokinase|nr:hypothetical protein [Tannerella sp.]